MEQRKQYEKYERGSLIVAGSEDEARALHIERIEAFFAVQVRAAINDSQVRQCAGCSRYFACGLKAGQPNKTSCSERCKMRMRRAASGGGLSIRTGRRGRITGYVAEDLEDAQA